MIPLRYQQGRFWISSAKGVRDCEEAVHDIPDIFIQSSNYEETIHDHISMYTRDAVRSPNMPYTGSI